MAVQIPLPWQLTDFLCALGLGALYGAVYRWGGLLPWERLHGRTRKLLMGVGELLWTLAAALFTRAWVLTGSRAAQLRWTAVLGILLGLTAFRAGMAPALKRLDSLLLRLFSPLRRLFVRVGRAADAARKRRAARMERKKPRSKKRVKKAVADGMCSDEKSRKKYSGNAKKELQNKMKMYYNNL